MVPTFTWGLFLLNFSLAIPYNLLFDILIEISAIPYKKPGKKVRAKFLEPR
jgi:hypothetical protein